MRASPGVLNPTQEVVRLNSSIGALVDYGSQLCQFGHPDSLVKGQPVRGGVEFANVNIAVDHMRCLAVGYGCIDRWLMRRSYRQIKMRCESCNRDVMCVTESPTLEEVTAVDAPGCECNDLSFHIIDKVSTLLTVKYETLEEATYSVVLYLILLTKKTPLGLTIVDSSGRRGFSQDPVSNTVRKPC